MIHNRRAELAAAFDVSVKTILVHLRQIGKVKKLDKWVPHELNDRQRETYASKRALHCSTDTQMKEF